MKKFLILDDGHGMDTIGKCSPIFDKQTKVGDLTFNSGQRFKENMFNEGVMNFLIEELRVEGIPFDQLAPSQKDIPLGERKLLQNDIWQKAVNDGFTPLTVSIHANGLGSGDSWNTVYGVETFHKQDEISLHLANLIQREVMVVRGKYKPFNFKSTNRGVKTANYYIFREFSGIVVLFEGEFMTNLESLKLLCSIDYQKEIAKAIKTAIINF